MRSYSFLGVSLMVLAGCQQPERPEQMQKRMDEETAAAKMSFATIATRYQGWVAAGQADSIASIFTEVGREMPPNGPAVVGRAAILAFETANAAALTSRLTITSEAAFANGPIGVERGTYLFEATAKKGAPKGTPASIDDKGKYLLHWHRVNGAWLIADQIWNSDNPVPPPPAPAKPAAKAPARRR